ncbi:MAG: ATPase [Bacteroides sp.]|nr:ATPase [Bacteroides sp.]
MILLADSGSTKTDWCLMQRGRGLLGRWSTQGLNPVFLSESEMAAVLRAELLPAVKTALSGMDEVLLSRVSFYGAGCLPERVGSVERALRGVLPLLPDAIVSVESDLMAACHALAGDEAGIVAILGTGSNSCEWNGSGVVAQVSPLGFILGDEGSGAVLGRLLVSDLLKNQLPELLRREFLETYSLSPADIITRVYRQPMPNRFLASLSPFVASHLEHPGVRRLVTENFRSFICRNLKQYRYRELPVHFCGSVAWVYRAQLEEVCREEDLLVGRIVRNPLERLVERYN